jgi:hypothetical protein
MSELWELARALRHLLGGRPTVEGRRKREQGAGRAGGRRENWGFSGGGGRSRQNGRRLFPPAPTSRVLECELKRTSMPRVR